MNWIKKNRLGLILGFIFGAIIAPFFAVLGLAIGFFEIIRPLLIGPMDLIGMLIPNVQTAPNTYHVPIYKWIITLGFNGLVYSILGAIIQNISRSLK